jgi:putative ABC transport system permease protein
MTGVAWRMLAHKPARLLITWAGLGALFFLASAQVGMLVGWCNTCSAIIRHADADVWVMTEQAPAFDYGTSIPRQRIYQARGVEGVARAEGMIMAWNTWQRPDGRRVNVELVGLDSGCVGGPWAMRVGPPASVHLPDSVIVDELFLDTLGVRGVGDEAEMYGRRAVVRGVSADVRTLTASPFVFTSMESARKYDKRYGPDEITYVLVRCSPGHSPEEVRDRLGAELSHVEVLTAREFAIRTMKYWMLETGLGITVVLTAALGLVVSAVVTSQTLFTVTQEHLSNYATLAAVGFGRTQLLSCVIIQGLVLASGGVLIGSALFTVAALASRRTPLPLETLPEAYAGLVVVSFASSLAGAFLSMRSVHRLDPASVFRG